MHASPIFWRATNESQFKFTTRYISRVEHLPLIGKQRRFSRLHARLLQRFTSFTSFEKNSKTRLGCRVVALCVRWSLYLRIQHALDPQIRIDIIPPFHPSIRPSRTPHGGFHGSFDAASFELRTSHVPRSRKLRLSRILHPSRT